MGSDLDKWCKYHKVKRHHTYDFHQLKKEIEILIHEVHLRRYSQRTSNKIDKRSVYLKKNRTNKPLRNKKYRPKRC